FFVCRLFCFFFFFQAEDGIRDFHVTGVQTCALPIFHAGAAPSACPAPRVPAAVPRGRCGRVAGRRTPRVPVLRRRSPSRRPRTGVRPVAGRGTARRGGGVSGGLPGQ